jgi:hypothetical protein
MQQKKYHKYKNILSSKIYSWFPRLKWRFTPEGYNKCEKSQL